MIVTDCLKERYQSRSSVLPHSRRNPTLGAKGGYKRGKVPGYLHPAYPTRPPPRDLVAGKGGKLSTFALHLHYYVRYDALGTTPLR